MIGFVRGLVEWQWVRIPHIYSAVELAMRRYHVARYHTAGILSPTWSRCLPTYHVAPLCPHPLTAGAPHHSHPSVGYRRGAKASEELGMPIALTPVGVEEEGGGGMAVAVRHSRCAR